MLHRGGHDEDCLPHPHSNQEVIVWDYGDQDFYVVEYFYVDIEILLTV